MKILFNGELTDLPYGITLYDLYRMKNLVDNDCFIHVNSKIINKKDFDNVKLKEHDKIETIVLCAGG